MAHSGSSPTGSLVIFLGISHDAALYLVMNEGHDVRPDGGPEDCGQADGHTRALHHGWSGGWLV